MAFKIPTFAQVKKTIVQEIQSLTGLTIHGDHDAAIRADGTASVVDGLYSHQSYIQKQLFIATADEPFLYIHAAELGLPRLSGTLASGTVTALSNVEITLTAGSKLTDGKSHYWLVTADTTVSANTQTIVNIVAEQIGASWNTNGLLYWLNTKAGLSGTVIEVFVGGGSDQEELEAWRARLLERKQLGLSRDREADLISFMKGVAGVKHVHVYPKRRGLGSLDVAITAVGNPPTLPTSVLIATAQTALDEYAGFWADCRVYSPTEQLVNVEAVITGSGVNLTAVRQVIRDYFAELAPAAHYQHAILSSRIVDLANVSDVALTPSVNVTPTVTWEYTKWLRLGTLNVSNPS